MRNIFFLALCLSGTVVFCCVSSGFSQIPMPADVGVGNVDGFLGWSFGAIAPEESKTQTVFLLFADSPEEARMLIQSVRAKSGKISDTMQPLDVSPRVIKEDDTEEKSVWISNETTDFSLYGPCFFRWEKDMRQSFRNDQGGQLSQFTYYFRYFDNEGEHVAGVPHYRDNQKPENIRIIQPVTSLSSQHLKGTVATEDGKVKIDILAACCEGPVVQVDFEITNLSSQRIERCVLYTYANFEANHDEANDYSTIDAMSSGLMVIDMPTMRTVLLAGDSEPMNGHAGTWNSFSQLRRGAGISYAKWENFVDFSEDVKEYQFIQKAIADGYYLPSPFKNPSTPLTKTLSTQEAEKLMIDDWDRQAQSEPWNVRTAKEIEWTRQLTKRILETLSHEDSLRRDFFTIELSHLDQIEENLENGMTPSDLSETGRKLYYDVRRIKRRIMFQNPVIDFQSVLMIDQPYQTHPEGEHESVHRMGLAATPGGRLLVLEGLSPAGNLRQLAPEIPHPDVSPAETMLGFVGSVWRPELSFDTQKVLFCYKPVSEKSFHIYEIGLDGTGVRQLTNSDYDDIDPIYLPDGKILFTTTRGNSYVRCGAFIHSYILARCDADGSNLRLISMNGEPDYLPSLLRDGRVLYSRWEYSDKPLWRAQSLWTTNQDGTNTSSVWGNQSVWPDHPSQPRQIPGSERIMFVGVGHHDWWPGSIGIIDPRKGNDFPSGLTKVTADLRWPECSIPPFDPIESPNYHSSGLFSGYQSPYPLSEHDFLVSARTPNDGKFRLYLMDVDGNRELIYEGVSNILHAFPIKPRPVPPMYPDNVVWPEQHPNRKASDQVGGIFYNPDIYQGLPKIKRGEVKSLRVMQLDHKTYSTWKDEYRNSGPYVSVVQEEGVKRVLSIIPVEEDGSVYFEAPSGVAIYFQLLDAEGHCLHTMRSFTGLMPGENRGCIGCHENQNNTSPFLPSDFFLAMKRPPTPLCPPFWGTESISYERFVQPVFEKYCNSCHVTDGEEGKKAIDFTRRLGPPGFEMLEEPYLTLVGDAGWYPWGPHPNPESPGYGFADVLPVESMDLSTNDPIAYQTLSPRKYLSAESRLVDLCASGTHYGVKVDSLSLQRIMIWIDACGPFRGEPEIRALPDPEFDGIERLPIRPRVKTAPVILRP